MLASRVAWHCQATAIPNGTCSPALRSRLILWLQRPAGHQNGPRAASPLWPHFRFELADGADACVLPAAFLQPRPYQAKCAAAVQP